MKRKPNHKQDWALRQFSAPSTINNNVKRWAQRVEDSRPRFEQCRHLISKFGGMLPFAIVVGWHPNTIIKHWLNGPEQGLVPHQELIKLIIYARYWGIYLTPKDVYPDLINESGVKPLIKDEELVRWLKSLQPHASLRALEDSLVSLVSIPE